MSNVMKIVILHVIYIVPQHQNMINNRSAKTKMNLERYIAGVICTNKLVEGIGRSALVCKIHIFYSKIPTINYNLR